MQQICPPPTPLAARLPKQVTASLTSIITGLAAEIEGLKQENKKL
jgi:hypothetical protein